MLNLIVVSHPDDEILGFGGTGAKLVKQGEIVQPIILSGNVKERSNPVESDELYNNIIEANTLLGFKKPILGDFPNIRMNTVDHIEIVKFIEEQILKFKPTRIFTHHPGDLNDDHFQTARACLPASRLFQRRTDINSLKAIYFMEILSSTDWSFPSTKEKFDPNMYVDITDTLQLKLQALSKYKRVMRPAPHPRSIEILTGHASSRGGQSGYQYAEAFQMIFKREL